MCCTLFVGFLLDNVYGISLSLLCLKGIFCLLLLKLEYDRVYPEKLTRLVMLTWKLAVLSNHSFEIRLIIQSQFDISHQSSLSRRLESVSLISDGSHLRHAHAI